jgi:hypothetical protein
MQRENKFPLAKTELLPEALLVRAQSYPAKPEKESGHQPHCNNLLSTCKDLQLLTFRQTSIPRYVENSMT